MQKKVLVVVDYQYDFVKGALPVPESETIAKAIQAEINSSKYDSVIYTLDTHVEEDYFVSEEAKSFPDIHCEFNTPGWELFKIQPRNREINLILSEGVMEEPKDFSVNEEFVFMKDKFSIWEGNANYAKWFVETFPIDTEIVIVGVATNFCVRFNAIGYKEFGYENVYILEQAVKGIPTPEFEEVIQEIKDTGILFI
jgi:nicotinamidase-related amidase